MYCKNSQLIATFCGDIHFLFYIGKVTILVHPEYGVIEYLNKKVQCLIYAYHILIDFLHK